MRISAVEEYGLRCLLALAKVGPTGQLSISEIAQAEGLSIPYASKLLGILRKSGLVVAARGRSGGFTIARDPKEIHLYEVLTSLGGPLIDPNHCQKYSGQHDECVHINNCSMHDVLGGLAGMVQDFLSRKSLAEIINADHSQRHFVPKRDLVVLNKAALQTELPEHDVQQDPGV